jgi:hypothetical protein
MHRRKPRKKSAPPTIVKTNSHRCECVQRFPNFQLRPELVP